jgi:hypothetical protein
MNVPLRKTRCGAFGHPPSKQTVSTVSSLFELYYAAIEFENRVEQDLGPSGAVLNSGRFRLAVTDAIEAWDEDHRSWRNASNISGIMTGA